MMPVMKVFIFFFGEVNYTLDRIEIISSKCSVTARELLKRFGCSERLYRDVFDPLLQVGLFAPAEQCSAAATIGMLYYFVLANQVSWMSLFWTSKFVIVPRFQFNRNKNSDFGFVNVDFMIFVLFLDTRKSNLSITLSICILLFVNDHLSFTLLKKLFAYEFITSFL